MSVACDFCQRLAERYDEIVFIQSPSGLAHICELCIEDCAVTLKARRAQESEK